jgi:zinc protease
MHLLSRRSPPILAALGAVVLFLAVLASAATPWPHELGDVAPDPAIRWGRLDNGLRYAVRQNAEPAGRVFLILQVAAGSVHERDDQRGYAHFVEHMLFRGTKKYPASSLVGFLQHEGLAMGADTSAFTNLTTTFYNLDLPQNTPEKITLGLSILRDFAEGGIFAKADVKREAKVVESERRTRESSASQIGDALTAYLHPDTLVTRRSPIGTPESVAHATAERLREFYRTWYRPSRMTLIAVGDADPDLLERLIREQFASLQPATPAEPVDPDLGFGPPPPADVQARFFASPTPAGTSSILYSLAPTTPEPDTLARRREQIVRNAAVSILDARLNELQRERPKDIGDSQASWMSEFGFRRQAIVRLDTRADLWRAGVRLAEQELRRALLHGFTPDEVKLQAIAHRNSYRESIRSAPNRQSSALAHAIRSGLEYNYINTSPETEWGIAEPVIDALTPEVCRAAFNDLWASPNRRVAVIGHYPSPLTDAEILSAYEESTYATFFTGKDERALAEFDYTDFGPPGLVASRSHEPRADIHSLAFANGVRVNLKQTDYEKNLVNVRLRLGRGMTAEPSDKPGLGTLAGGTFTGGGLGRYDNVELGRMLAGDSLSFNFSVEEDGFFFTGNASSDKLPKLLQLIAAFITDPAFRPEGWQTTFSRLQSHYPTVVREPAQYLRSICPTVMAGGDSRYGLALPAMVQDRQPKEVEEWLRPVLATGSIELGLAGDLDPDAAIEAVARTLGALPKRQADAVPDPNRRPSLPAKSIHQTWLLENSEPGKAAVHVYWPGVENDDYLTSRRLQVLAQILKDRLRLKIREELGATYGPLEDVWGSDVWHGYGYLFVEIETSPAMAERVATLTRRIAADLATKGITPDEFERVLEPRLASLKQELRQNGYWTYHVLSRMQEKPRRLEWPLTREQDYRSIKREDVEAVARRTLGADRIYTFIARPK